MAYLAGYVTPQDYGALGDNTTDDTTAIQNAINAVALANSGTLFFPAATYKITTALTLNSANAVSFLGLGPGISVINQTGTAVNGITYNPTFLTGASITNMSITGPGSGSGIGVLMQANSGSNPVTSCNMENVAVSGFGSHNIQFSDAIGCSLDTVNSASSGGHCYFLNTGTGNTLSNCYANGGASTQQGFQLTTMNYTTLDGCKAFSTGGGFQVTGGSAVQFSGCGASTVLAANGQDGSGFKINGGTSHVITGCYSTVNRAKAFYVTGSAVAATLMGVQEVAPGAGATASVQVDSGSTATVIDSSVVTATNYTAGTTMVLTAGAVNAPKNVTVGSTAALGDNGVGEIQLANAATPPTTNPTGGAVLFARNGGLVSRDPNGVVAPLISDPGGQGATTNAISESVPRVLVTTSAAPVSGTLFIQSTFIPAGISIGHIGFATGTTAANGPTHWWAALLDNTYKQQAHSTDQTTGAIAASTWFNLAMATPFVTTYTGTYYLALLVATSTTQPTILQSANTPAAQFWTGTSAPTPLPNGASTAALTAPGTDNTTVYAAPTVASAPFYLYCSA